MFSSSFSPVIKLLMNILPQLEGYVGLGGLTMGGVSFLSLGREVRGGRQRPHEADKGKRLILRLPWQFSG